MLLTVDQVWVIRTATWIYVGRVVKIESHGVWIKDAFKVHYLADEPTWLETGKFSKDDEAFPVKVESTFIPALWIGPSDLPNKKFLEQMTKWKRTHEPVETRND